MKTKNRLLAAALALCATAAQADDIDIYVNGASRSGTPYLHLMLDYRPSVFNVLCKFGTSCKPPFFSEDAYANLAGFKDALDNPLFSDGDNVSTFMGFVAVLKTVMANDLYKPVRVALLAPNFEDGGTILKGYTQLGADTGLSDKDGNPILGRNQIIDVLTSVPEATVGADAHKLSPKETYLEWFRYLRGGRVLNGTKTQYNFTSGDYDPVPNYDATIINKLGGGAYGAYDSPFDDADECPKMYSMVMAMNVENNDDDWDDTIETEMSALAAQKGFENMLTWLHRSDTDLIPTVNTDVHLEKTWIITDAGSVGATPDWAEAGGTGSPINMQDPREAEVALSNAFKEVISVSSTFVAASVPVNVFNQIKTLDNLYVALFEAKSTLSWPGNLKKLKLADTFSLDDPNDPSARDGVYDTIVDAKGNAGFESTGDDKGRITFDALTFWTDAATLPDPGADDTIPVGADGREVARGGAGQKIDGFVNYALTKYFIGDTNSDSKVSGYGPRQVFVEPASLINGTAKAFTPLDADSATVTALKSLLDPGGTLTSTQVKNLIRWARGQDVDNSKSTARSWILADAMHSRPFALNYGKAGGHSESNPNIRIFMGTNDGMFHIIENTDTAGNETGREIFTFYPREMLKNISLRRADSIPSSKMRYGVDGAPAVLTKDLNSDGTIDAAAGDKAYVYFGLRRGGSSYYALDVSNPDSPKMLWKIGKTSGGDFDELGLTFSTPVVGKVKYNGSSVDVLVFAGGYNGGWNSAYTTRVGKDLNDADDTVGNAIYIVNALTGQLIWKAIQGTTGASTNTIYQHAGLVDSIPSDVTVLENFNGNIHRIYVGDTGGAIWRVDLPEVNESDPTSGGSRAANWFITKLAELGTDGSSTDRRFFHAPDVVESYDAGGDFDGLLIESGNRADPNETNVQNYMLYIKDRLVVSGSAVVKAENSVANPPGRYVITDLADQTACVTGSEAGCAASVPNGWKIAMQRSGEKGLSTPLVDAGRVFFTTFRPGRPLTCEPAEGQGSIYVVNLSDGTATANDQRIYEIGPGIPPGAILIGDVILLPGGGIDLYDLDGDGVRDNTNLTKSLTKKLYRIFWREPGIDQL